MNRGFFSRKQIHEMKEPSSPEHRGRRLSCVSCGLYKAAESPKIDVYGSGEKRLMVIGEAPGSDEDRLGKPWQGQAGMTLQRVFRKFGFSLFRDCWSINSINCRPPSNRAPKPFEIACCRQEKVGPALKRYKPRVVAVLGNPALQSVVGRVWVHNLGTISRWRGWMIPDRDLGAWVCPMYHSSYINREDRQELELIWEGDIKRMLHQVGVPFPEFAGDEWESVVLLRAEADIVGLLNRVSRGEEGKWVCFDYETTGLKPQVEGSRIVCASVATESAVYAFMFPRSGPVVKAWKRFMHSRTGKTAHSIAFEDTWTEVILRVKVRNWLWDSMLAGHVLDNRVGINSLEFQSYVRFGLLWKDEIKKWFGKLYEMIAVKGDEDLLRYCGIDSWTGRRLVELQMRELGVYDGII